MQFLYHEAAGEPQVILEGDPYRYLFKVRRFRIDETIVMRNMQDGIAYGYRITSIDRRRATLVLESRKSYDVVPKRRLHLGWCVVDPKTVEKALPALNEIGVGKITFIDCRYSQRHFKIDERRLKTILINSSQQCGRTRLMEFAHCSDLASFIDAHPEAYLLDFADEPLRTHRQRIETLVIGSEGGLSDEERGLFPKERIVGLDSRLILRSETAACASASILLL